MSTPLFTRARTYDLEALDDIMQAHGQCRSRQDAIWHAVHEYRKTLKVREAQLGEVVPIKPAQPIRPAASNQ